MQDLMRKLRYKKRQGNESSSVRPISFKRLHVAIVEFFTAPRVDANVTTQKGHLVRGPFSVNPKTGFVKVPIDIEKLSSFDPQKSLHVSDDPDEIRKKMEECVSIYKRYMVDTPAVVHIVFPDAPDVFIDQNYKRK